MFTKIINWKIVVISSLLLVILDFIYLYINKKWYIHETEISQSRSFELKWSGVFLRYLTQALGLNLFVLQHNGTPVDAFIYGLIIYGNYIGTNYSTIKIFDETLACVDLLKGGIIMALTTSITYYIIR